MPDVPVDDFDKASEPSSVKEWCDGSPGPGCSVDDLRWYLIREVGKMKRAVNTVEKNEDKHSIDIDILKAKIREKLDGDQVSAKVAKALEHVPHLVDFEAFKKKHTEDVDEKMKTGMQGIEAEMQELRSHLGSYEVGQSRRFCDVEDTVED